MGVTLVLKEFRTMVRDNPGTFLEDAIGVLALMVILFGTLHLPSLF